MHLWIVSACAAIILAAPLAALAITRTEPGAGTVLDRYFHIRPFETAHHHALSRGLGVRAFQRLLRFWYDRVLFAAHLTIGVRLFRQPRLSAEEWRRVSGHHLPTDPDRRANLATVRRNSRRLELIHLAMLIPSIPIVACFALAGYPAPAAAFAALTWLINVWPVLLHRYNRARIEAALRILDREHTRLPATGARAHR